MIIKDIAELQNNYKKMIESNTFSKKRLIEICVPFRDKYHLTDGQTVAIAREEMSMSQIYELVGDVE